MTCSVTYRESDSPGACGECACCQHWQVGSTKQKDNVVAPNKYHKRKRILKSKDLQNNTLFTVESYPNRVYCKIREASLKTDTCHRMYWDTRFLMWIKDVGVDSLGVKEQIGILTVGYNLFHPTRNMAYQKDIIIAFYRDGMTPPNFPKKFNCSSNCECHKAYVNAFRKTLPDASSLDLNSVFYYCGTNYTNSYSDTYKNFYMVIYDDGNKGGGKTGLVRYDAQEKIWVNNNAAPSCYPVSQVHGQITIVVKD